jgi:hypothetical protein
MTGEEVKIGSIRNVILFALIGILGVSMSIMAIAPHGRDYTSDLALSSLSAVDAVTSYHFGNSVLDATGVITSNPSTPVANSMATIGSADSLFTVILISVVVVGVAFMVFSLMGTCGGCAFRSG